MGVIPNSMRTIAGLLRHHPRCLTLALVAVSVLASYALPARAFVVNVGDILIANYDNWTVVRIDPSTGEQVVWGGFLHPMDLVLHPSGTLYIGEFYGDIQALDVATEEVAPLALSGDLPTEIWGLTLGPNGRLYVTGKNLDDVDSVFEVNLDTGISTIMTQGNLLSGVAGIATLDSTHLVVTSALDNRLVSVSLVDHSQTTLVSGGQVDSPYDVAVYGGKLFTGAYDSKWLLEVNGGNVTVLANLLGSPWGIDIDADGIIAVGIKATSGGVQRFDQDGRSRGSFSGPSIGWVAGLEIADYGVFGPPKITTQPQSQAVVRGANATFTVVATGSLPIAYQWYFNQTQVIPWGTGASLTITNVQDTSVGGYSVVVDNGVAVTSSIAQLTIKQPELPLVTWPSPADITYGTALGPSQLNATANVPGTFVYSPLAGTLLDAGPAQVLSVTFTPSDTGAYLPATKTVSIDVLRRHLTITANNSNKVFGAPLPDFSATYTGFVAGDAAASLDTPVTYSTTATASSPVGTYPITPGEASDANYTIAFEPGTLTIAKASTTSRVSSSANPAAPGQSVTFTMEVTAVAPGAGIPTGTVQFMLDGANAGALASLSAGSATLSLTTIGPGIHTISASYAGDDNFTGSTATLASAQLINTPPTAGADTIQRYPTDGTKVLISTLLSNDTDADGDPLELVFVSPTSAHGGSLLLDGDWIHYTPPAGFTNDDSFTYTIQDSYSAQATATVTVRATTDAVPPPNLLLTDLGNGSFLLSLVGIPGKTYRIESTEQLGSPVWTELGSDTADDLGAVQYTDTSTPAGRVRFYRSVYP